MYAGHVRSTVTVTVHTILPLKNPMACASRQCGSVRSLGLCVISSLILFSPLIEGGTTHFATMVIRLLILGGFVVYWSYLIRTRHWSIPNVPVGLPILVFIGVVVVSTFLSPYTNQSLQWLMVCLSYAGLLYLLAAFVRRWEDVSTVLNVLIWSALIQAMWVCIQTYQGEMRPTGTFFNPNFTGGYLAAMAVIVLAVTSYGKAWWHRSQLGWRDIARRIFPFVALVFLLGALLQTGSRGGALALMVGASVVLVLRFGRRGLIGLVLLVAVATLVPNPIRDRVVSEHIHNPVAYARWHMWQGALHEMIEHPFGSGIGLYQYVYPRHAFPVEGELFRFGKMAHTPHNEYVQIGVELGVLGLIVFFWGLVQVAKSARWLLRQRLSREQRGMIVGVCGACLVVLTQAATDSNLHEPALAVVLAVCVAIISLGRTVSTASDRPAQWAGTIRRPILAATVATIVIGLFAAHVTRLGLAYQAYEAGTVSSKNQRYEQAIEQLSDAIRLDPGKSLYHQALAGTYFQVFQRLRDHAMIQAAIAELQTATALNPIDGRLHALLGFVYASNATTQRTGDGQNQNFLWLQQAVAAYESAVELEPFVYTHRIELGRLMMALGRPAAAEQHWKTVVDLEPNYLPIRAALIHLYAKTGWSEQAEQQYQEIIARLREFHSRTAGQLEQSFLHVDVSALDLLRTGKVRAT